MIDNRLLLLLTILFMWQLNEARIIDRDDKSATNHSQDVDKSIEVEFSCKVKVNDHLLSLNCSRICSNYFKGIGGWIQQNLYYLNLKVWKKFNKTVEIATDQDITVECDFFPAPTRPQQDHERIKRSPSSQLPPLVCDASYRYNKKFDSCLRISSEAANWDGARYTCESEGGNLVTIDSEVKQNAIRTLLDGINDVYWIGLNDINDEGNFVWADDTPLCYTSWDIGEPNNERHDENCIFIWKIYAGKDRNYTWNDSLCYLKYRFICQKKRPTDVKKKPGSSLDTDSTIATCPDSWEKSTISDSCYHVGSEVFNFDDAEEYCYKAAGSLASIANFNEQEFVNEYLKKNNIGDVWIGYSDRREENNFDWTDNSRSCYTRWIVSQPDNFNDQDCVRLVRQSEYKWDDESCGLLLQPLCKQKAKQLFVHTCPSGCLLIKETKGDNRGIENRCTTAAPGSRFCTSSMKVDVTEKPAVFDIRRPADKWSEDYCGARSFDPGFDVRKIYQANHTAKEYERMGFTVKAIEVNQDLLIKYEVNNGTHIFIKGGNTDDKISGGDDARRVVTVYAAVLGKIMNPEKKDIKWFCGGVIINRKWVLSAAHCFNSWNPDVIRLGDYNVRNDERTATESHEDYKLKRLIVYPAYQYPSQYHDLALIELDREINYFRPDIRPVCLPWDSEINVDLVGKEVTVTGWGATAWGGSDSAIAREVTVTVFDHQKCEKGYSTNDDYNVKFPNGIGRATTLCAGAVDGIKDSCQGDSGGPAVYQAQNYRFTLAGIVSVGYGCGLKEYPGIYVPMHRPEYLTWIKREAFSKKNV